MEKSGVSQHTQTKAPAFIPEWDLGLEPGLELNLEKVLRPVSEETRRTALERAASLPDKEPVVMTGQAYFSRIPAGGIGEPYACQEIRLLAVLRGSGRLLVGGSSLEMEPGALALLGEGTPHQLLAGEDTLAVSIRFSRCLAELTLLKMTDRYDLLREYFRKALAAGENGYLFFREPENENMVRLLSGLLREGRAQEVYSDFFGVSCMVLLFAVLLRYYSLACDVNWDVRGDSPQATVPAILLTIRDRYRTASLGELARQFGYNESYLSVLLKKTTGRNFTDLIACHRLAEAKYLLQKTDLPLQQVASRTGFGSAVHLSRSFRQSVGETPGSYRRRAKSENQQ